MQFVFASFQNESWRRRTKNYVYNENPKQIRESELTTFEALFMQNAKQIIAEKVIKPPQNSSFEAVFGPSGETRTPGILLPKQARYQLRYTRL